MPPQTLKNSCDYCGKSYLTYEADKIFCNSTCEGKFKYNKHFRLIDRRPITETNCEQCGELLSIRGVREWKFCNELCRKQNKKDERAKKSMESPTKTKKPVKRLPYEVL